jgi:prepilin-type N-terminal cleavage/methylation domain-containing protein
MRASRSQDHATRAQPAGLTLVEVMIVVVILGIIAVMAVPRFGETDESRLSAAARLLAADLAFVQAESLAHADAPRGVRFDTAASAYSVVFFADVAPHDCAAAAVLTHPAGGGDFVTTFGAGRGAPLAGVTIDEISLGGDACVVFEALGQLDQASPATITLRCGTRTLTLAIDPETGEVHGPGGP